ncbi:probable serine/threonine-protein kinase kinX isoform X2 [Dysidea avara]|uniref:probable serine/threonine-protein kinase kinX isoform X2 n=1 Tax=Dysidea avara TaxID=196820 RepID=UPI0033311B9A
MWGSNKPNFLETAKFSIIENITITPRELGRGSYGTVYAAVYNGKPCVAKELHPYLSYHKSGQNISTPMDIFVKEINTMSSLKHPSIVQFLGVYFKKDSPILVMERMWKNLSDLLEEQPNQLSLLIKTHILYDVACGLQYLHGQKKPVIHRDLHASNILVNDNLEAKIADLGQAKGLENLAGQQLSTAPGKTAHMAPETLKHNPTYDVKMDIFSFGCTVIHLVTEKFPTPSDQFVLSGNGTNSFTKVSEVARRKEAITVMANITILQQIVLQCLHDEPSHRPNMSDICVQLTRYIKEMETQSPSLAQLYKQDKLSLLHSCQSQIDQSKRNREIIDELTQEKIIKENYITEKEDYIAALELELKDARSKLKQSEQIAFSLKKELDKQVKINNQVTKNYQNRVDRLQEDLKTKQHETRLKTEELIKTCTEKEDMVVQLKKRLQEKESQLKESGSKLHKWLLELQQVNETKHQQLHQQLLSYTNAFKFQKANTSALQTQMLDFKKKSAILKQQLEEKSYRLSVLESSHSELQELFYAREEKLKTLEQEISVLGKLLENNDRLQRNLEKDLNSKEGSLKQKNEELQLQKKEHADKLNKLHAQYAQEIEDLRKDNEMCKSQTADQGELSRLLEAEGHFKSDLVINTEKRFTKQENDIKVLLKEREDFKKQINHQEINIKEKVKYIEKLEKKSFNVFSSQYYLSITWYQYMSLPVHRCRPSAVVIKDKVFITGGYQKVCPQRKDLYSYLKYLERGNEVFCFNAGKCRYDSIASPVVLGGVVSVNGQCVLVSGAEGNTLTGNVYVLCEEGSDEQWKKFSEPVPTPRILPCVCCYDERWMIVCGGYACKEGSSLLEAVNVVEILDTINGEWYALADEKCLGVSAILCCAVAGEDLYIIGDLKIFKCNSNKLITVVTRQSESSMLLSWYQVDMQINDLGTRDLHPFSVAEINGEPMIIASISGSTNDVTCVLMKDTTDTWRKMNEAVECQHCSAVVVTPTLELLLFGGSQKVSSTIATNTSQKGSIIPVLNLSDIPPLQEANKSKETLLSVNSDTLHDITGTINQPPAVSFTGPIHAKHFDHKGGTFQSPVHKVSIVVPPNAIDDGEKVTVYMGATTSGPFDLPEDCKLRSAVVWLGSGSDVVLKRNIAVVVPHSAVFTSPHHHSMMRINLK